MFEVVGVDLFKSETKQFHVASQLDLSAVRAKAGLDKEPEEGKSEDADVVPDLFVVNMQIPGYAPNNPLW